MKVILTPSLEQKMNKQIDEFIDLYRKKEKIEQSLTSVALALTSFFNGHLEEYVDNIQYLNAIKEYKQKGINDVYHS